MAKYILFITLSAVAICTALDNCLAEDTHENSTPINIFTGSEVKIGTYVIRSRNEVIPVTLSDYEKVSDVQYSVFPLIDQIKYASGSVLAITVYNDGTAVEDRLEKLMLIPENDLHHLVVFGQLNGKGLKLIATKPRLRQLLVESSAILETVEGCEAISNLSKLEYLSVFDSADTSAIGSKFCETIGRLPSLRYLSIPADGLTNIQVQKIASSTTLEAMHLRTNKGIFTGKTLRKFSEMKTLRALTICCTDDITASDLLAFASLKRIETLSICTEADESIAAPLKRLRPNFKVNVVPLSNLDG